MLINVKMPTIADILSFISMIYNMQEMSLFFSILVQAASNRRCLHSVSQGRVLVCNRVLHMLLYKIKNWKIAIKFS